MHEGSSGPKVVCCVFGHSPTAVSVLLAAAAAADAVAEPAGQPTIVDFDSF